MLCKNYDSLAKTCRLTEEKKELLDKCGKFEKSENLQVFLMEGVGDNVVAKSDRGVVNCDLCKLIQHLDETYFENNQVIIDDCLKCGRKIVLFKEHSVVVDNAIKFHVQKVVSDLFKKAVNIDWRTVEFPTHWHCHVEEG